MKIYTPPPELLDIDLVLKYDTEHTVIFSTSEKTAIRYKRAKLMAGINYTLDHNLTAKIQFHLEKIKENGWKPINPIEYDQNT